MDKKITDERVADAMKRFLENGFDGKPLEPSIEEYATEVTDLYKHMHGENFTESEYYVLGNIHYHYEEDLKDSFEIQLKRSGFLPLERFNIQVDWKNTHNDHWESQAMLKIINREHGREATAVLNGDRMTVSVYTLDPAKQMDVRNTVKKSWARKDWFILPFADVTQTNKFVMELSNGQTITAYVNAPTNDTRDRMFEYGLCFEGTKWSGITRDKGGRYCRIKTWDKINFPKVKEAVIGIVTYAPVEKMKQDEITEIAMMNYGHYVGVGGKVGDIRHLEKLSAEDSAEYRKNCVDCTSAEIKELAEHYAKKYLAFALDNEQEQRKGYRR